MPNKMLIDASHPEETRVVVVRGNRIEEFDFESQDKKQLKGNIYLARVTRVEPSLQAAFVEYGGNRHGFLAFSEIHPDYYQIPMADRQALLRAEAQEAEDEDEDEDGEERGRNRRRRGRDRDRRRDEDKAKAAPEAEGEDGTVEVSTDELTIEAYEAEPATEQNEPTADSAPDTSDAEGEAPETGEGEDGEDDDKSGPRSMAASVDADVVSSSPEDAGDASQGMIEEVSSGDDNEVESVGAEDAIEEARDRRRPVRRHYKIQEVIKRRQILLVQVVKEERGNKGAALTTYLSLAGRYSVLMPNTARGGGISRKITNAQDRKRLKEVVAELEVPKGMGVILRTAGESRTKAEIKRDYEYLMRMWENVRSLTLQSTAPALVYEEGSLIKRSVRDLYNKDIDEILVSGEEGYREAKDFMRMLMPSHAKVVQPYRDTVPILVRSGIESQLDRMLQPQVTLKSGGYIIINQTEALVAIDVNSGRSTKEHSIEETALHTNLEAAEEVARQLRLRDLAGLIVIDFIDMEENRNNRAVEKKLKDCLKNDRARIQVGRISHFGLLEMSRQRIRASVLESTMKPCPHCGGTGHVRSDSSVALLVIRAIEEFLLKDSKQHITVRTPAATALYVLNHKRATLVDLERRFSVTITLEADESVGSAHYSIVRGAVAEKPAFAEVPTLPVYEEVEEEDEIVEIEDEADQEEEAAPRKAEASAEQSQQNGEGNRKRRRRRRRRGRDRDGANGQQDSNGEDENALDASTDADEDEAEGADEAAIEVSSEQSSGADGDAQGKKRRRGKRGGKRNRREDGDTATSFAGDDQSDADEESGSVEQVDSPELAAVSADEAVDTTPEAPVEAGDNATETEAPAEPVKKPRRSRAKKAAEPAVATSDEPVAEEEAKPARKRPSRRKASAEPAAESEPEAAAVGPEVETAPDAVAVAEAEAEAEVDTQPTETAPAPQPEKTADEAPADDKPKKGGWWQRRGFL